MSDLNTEIRIGADASGVETGVNKAKKSLASLGAAALQAGREAAKGVASVGEGGDKSAKQVESATKSIVSSLQRQIAAFEAGGRGTRAYQESLARIRGVDVSALKPLLDQLDASKAKAQAAAQANVALGASYQGLGSAALVTSRAVAAIGIGLSVREFVQMADASTNVASRLSLVTNSASELVSVQRQLFAIAQSSRVSFVDLAQTYSQMSRATKELGVSQADMLAITKTISQAVTISGGSAQSAQAALIQLSQGFASGALRGEELNSIMEQTPRLAQAIANGLGVGIGKLREMGKEGELTAEAVLGALKKSAAGIEAEFARMTPTVEQSITKITNSMLKLVGAMDSVFKVTSAVSTAFGYVSKALDFVSADLDKINSQGALREAASQVLTLNQRATQLRNGLANGFYGPQFKAELESVNRELAIAKQRFRELNEQTSGGNSRDQSAFRSRSQSYDAEAARQAKLADDLNNVRLKLAGVPESYVKEMKEIIRLNQEGLLVGKEYTDALKKQQETLDKKGASAAAAALTAEQNAYENLISSIRTKIESERLELAVSSTMTDSQKIRIKLDQELASGKLKLSAAHRVVATAALEELAALERQKLAADALKANDAERARIAEELGAAYVAESKAREQGRQSVNDYVQAIDEQNALTQLEINLSGKSEAAREIAIRQYRIALDLKKQIEAIDRNPGFDEGQREEERTRVRAAAAKAAASAEASVYLEEWKKTSEALESSITDALMRGFENGKDAAMNLRDTVVNMFKTMVLRPVVQATVQGGIQAASGLLGLGGSGDGGGILGSLSNLSSINSIGSLISNGITQTIANVLPASLSASLGLTSSALMASNAALAGGGASGAAAASAAAAAGNGAALGGAGGALAAIPGWGWALGGALALFGSGALGDVFGGERTNGAKGIEGNFSGSGFRGNSFQEFTESGGWFGSDSSGKDVSGLDAATTDKFTQSYAAIQLAAAQAANSLGLSADAVTSYSERISLVLTDDAAANEKAITALFAGIGDRMAGAVAPGLTAFSKAGEGAGATLSRLATSLTAANTWLSMLDQTLFSVSLTGGDAASKLADAFGGLDKLTDASKAFYELYYSESERAARGQEDIAKALAAVNLAIPSTKDELRDLAATLDLNTDAGRQAYAVLLSIAPQFAANTEALAKAAAEAADALFKSFSDSAKINFAGLTGALVGVSADTFARTLGLVFEDLAKRIQGVIDSIATERTATANAMLQINGPGVMTKDAIERGIAGTALVTPGNAGLTAAQAALGRADAKVAAQNAAVALAKAQTPSTSALDAARAVLNEAKRATDAAQAGVDFFRGLGNANFNAFMDQAFAGNDLRGTVPNPSGERNAQEVVFALLAAQRAQGPAQAAYDAALSAFSGAGSANASLVAVAQAKLTAALAEQAAAVAAARTAQLAYISSLQDFAIDAGKSVIKLGQLREETLKYYEAQKQLADLMGASAAGLRNAVSTARNGQLDPAQSLAQQQTAFQTAYSLALATTGATQAGFADKLTAALPGLSTALMDTAGTREEWARATGTLFAQSEAIAKQLEANAPQNYAADSLAMLGQIDAALAVLDASSKSAEKIIADAVTAGSEKTADGLRAVIAALTGKPVPAFAAGGDHQGGLRIVGERGMELEATGPSRIWSASQTAAMLSGGGNSEMVLELRALREEVRGLRAEAQATAGHTSKTTRLLERAMPDGDAIATREAEPL